MIDERLCCFGDTFVNAVVQYDSTHTTNETTWQPFSSSKPTYSLWHMNFIFLTALGRALLVLDGSSGKMICLAGSTNLIVSPETFPN